MFIIIEWISNKNNFSIVNDEYGDEASGYKLFSTKERAKDFADKYCAFKYKIVEI